MDRFIQMNVFFDNYYVNCALNELNAGIDAFGAGLREIFSEDDWDNMGNVDTKAEGRGSSIQDQGETTYSIIDSAPQTDNSIGNTDKIHTHSSDSAESRLADEQSGNSDASVSNMNTEAVTSKEVNSESVVSPTDTISVSSDTTDKNVPKNSSAETLTVVSAESPSDIPDDCVAVTNLPVDNPVSSDGVTTREKGDIVVVVGENNGSDSVSPPTSESNSHNKETDDDWEKDFDIEVTEDDINQVQDVVSKDDLAEPKEEEDDWENWE